MKRLHFATVPWLVFLALSSTSTGQDSIPLNTEMYFTHRFANGRYWERLKAGEKAELVNGIRLGVYLFAQESGRNQQRWDEDEKTTDRLITAGLGLQDVAKQLDMFYDDRANIQTPVQDAYLYAARKINGDDARTLDELAAAFRRSYNK